MAEQFGKYQIINKIATGGMAEVYRAKITGEKGFEKLVVIKKVLPHLAAEDKWIMHFTDEAKLAALLQHENIIHVYDFGKIDDSWYIAMEYLSGKDLKSVMTQGVNDGLLPGLELILHIMKGICDGLDYAHSLKDLRGNHLQIIHRDVSPQNIFITFDGKVKIIDFGIAKAAERSVQTQAGTIKGKLAYMAPEHAEGKPIDHRSDVFSAGILFYELLTGKRMYEGSMSDILLKVVTADFEPATQLLSGYPSSIFDILDKALARNPEDRYSSAGDMAADIEACLFEMDMRSGSRSLAAYMKNLFPEDHAMDVYQPVETQDFTPDGTSHIEQTKVLTDDETRADDDTNPKTVALRTGKTGTSIETLKREATKGIHRGITVIKTIVSDKPVAVAAVAACLVLIVSIMGIVAHNRNADEQMRHYLTIAEERMEEGNLTEPTDDSAYFYFSQALDIDDDNEEAIQGIDRVVQRKIELAESLLSRFRHQAAMEHIESGLVIDPDNEHLLELKQTAETKVGDRVLGGLKSLFKSSDEPQEEEVGEEDE